MCRYSRTCARGNFAFPVSKLPVSVDFSRGRYEGAHGPSGVWIAGGIRGWDFDSMLHLLTPLDASQRGRFRGYSVRAPRRGRKSRDWGLFGVGTGFGEINLLSVGYF